MVEINNVSNRIMKGSNWIKAFNDFLPLPLSAVMWLSIAFIISAMLNGFMFSLEYALFISVLVFNGITIASITMWLIRKGNTSKIFMRKSITSLVFFFLLNIVLMFVTSWKYLIVLLLIPIPLLIGLYFLLKHRIND